MTLDDATISGGGHVTDWRIRNGLTLDDAYLYFFGDAGDPVPRRIEPEGPAQSISGTGTLHFYHYGLLATTPGETLTLGEGITVKGVGGRIGGPGRSIVNLGTIISDDRFSSRFFVYSGEGSSFVNRGTLRVMNTTIVDTGPGFRNEGTIEMEGGSLVLRGNVSPNAIGKVNFHAGDIWYEGNLDNTGQTLSTAGLPRLLVYNSTISGGRISTSGGGPLLINDRPHYAGYVERATTFDEVTLDGNVSVSGTLRIVNGLTLDEATITPERLAFDTPGNHLLSGHGRVMFGQHNSGDRIDVTAGLLTVGDGVTIAAGRFGGTIASREFPLVNRGVISAAGPGGFMTIDARDFQNFGTLEARNGGRIILNPFDGEISSPRRIVLDGGTLHFSGQFTTAELGQRLRGLNVEHRNNAAVVVGGTIDNSGATLRLTHAVPLGLSGRLLNGRVTGRPPLHIRGTNTILDHVTLDADLRLAAGSKLRLLNGTTLAPGSRVAMEGNTTSAVTSITAEGPLEVPARTRFLFNAPSANAQFALSTTAGHPLAIARHARLESSRGRVTLGREDAPLINNGLIVAGESTYWFNVLGSSVVNEGTLRVEEGGTMDVRNLVGDAGELQIAQGGRLQLSGPGYWLDKRVTVPRDATLALAGDWRNRRGITVNSGTLELHDFPNDAGPLRFNDATLAVVGNISTARLLSLPAAHVVARYGNIDNDGAVLDLSRHKSWTLEGGGITGGAIAGAPGRALNVRGDVGYIFNTRITRDLDLRIEESHSKPSVHMENITLDNADFSFASFGGVAMVGLSGELQGAGQIIFNQGTVITRLSILDSTRISPRITITPGTGDALVQGGTVTNAGTLSSLVPGRTFTLAADSVVNEGRILAGNGGTFVNSSFLHNSGLIQAESLRNDRHLLHSSGLASLGHLSGHGVLEVAPGQHIDAKTLHQHQVRVREDASISLSEAASEANFSSLSSLTIAAGGRVDLRDQDVLVQPHDNSSSRAELSRLEELIARARNFGSARWNVPGLTSTLAADNEHYTLALLANRDDRGFPVIGSFHGQAVTADALFVLYTLTGDTDFDGIITELDFDRFDRGLAARLSGYRNGDFDYDGTIDLDDYRLIQAASQWQSEASSTQVPEPTCLIGAAAVTLLARRRRKAPKALSGAPSPL